MRDVSARRMETHREREGVSLAGWRCEERVVAVSCLPACVSRSELIPCFHCCMIQTMVSARRAGDRRPARIRPMSGSFNCAPVSLVAALVPAAAESLIHQLMHREISTTPFANQLLI
jgi:hypothetical protein